MITGASSGIGRSLAQAYAGPGIVLGLLGRNGARLTEVAELCRRAGAEVELGIVDVSDAGAMHDWLDSFGGNNPVDLLIANAGVTGGLDPETGYEAALTSRAVMETNLLGVLNTIHPMLGPMTKRKAGQIAIVSSIAAFVPVTDSPSYAASKAAVLHYGLALRSGLRSLGIRVSVVCPGYVATPMALREIGPRPFEISAERAAELTLRGLRQNKAVIAFPAFLAFITRLGGILPDGVRQFTERWFRFNVVDSN